MRPSTAMPMQGTVARLLCLLLLLSACSSDERLGTEPKAAGLKQGRRLVQVYGCVHCHQLSEFRRSTTAIGPPLNDWSSRSYIAGRLPNTHRQLERWLLAPRRFKRFTAMPDLSMSEAEARAIAAYLYSQ